MATVDRGKVEDDRLHIGFRNPPTRDAERSFGGLATVVATLDVVTVKAEARRLVRLARLMWDIDRYAKADELRLFDREQGSRGSRDSNIGDPQKGTGTQR